MSESTKRDPSARQWRSWLRMAQAVVTMSLMAWLFSQIDWSSLWSLLIHAHWGLIALSMGLLIINHLINVGRWQYLLEQRAIGFGTLLVLYGAGVFSNNFLPTGVGGDGVRVALLSRYVPLGKALFSVVLDRGIGLIALSAPLILGLWLGLPAGLEIETHQRLTLFGQAGGLVMTLLALAIFPVLILILWRCLYLLRERLVSAGAYLAAKWDILVWLPHQWPQRLAVGYIISVISHLFIVAALWSILMAMGVEVSPIGALWMMIIGSLSLLLPIAVNGMGLLEGVYVVVLSSYGIPPSIGLGVALAMRGASLLVSLLGGLLMLNRRALRIEAP